MYRPLYTVYIGIKAIYVYFEVVTGIEFVLVERGYIISWDVNSKHLHTVDHIRRKEPGVIDSAIAKYWVMGR